ncbi:DNA double-strand break repair and VJ recombination XRCC4 [Moelleriella libera RCEF 2490]|uniref:DNA double-strand break repair and VJ recombination XRCC4 n=1 Tax=Moelleriella libera RCEF 2490 TaxID=1081109 RepID=A0A168E6R7_9HYPO|nr:DNA double-strand break repair and VJ recombination XRCC4 [Moelleriella libera RCEF 2490]
MARARVIKVPRTDNDSSHALIHISSNGSKLLDLKLVGTEGEAAYACTLRHDRLSSLRVNNCPVTSAEWEDILKSVFEPEPLPDIQVAATIQTESSITLTVRKQVQGITQRLGDLTLGHSAAESIELFDWCLTLADAAAHGREVAAETAAELRGMHAAVDELKSQLDELLQAKADDEVALLQKFRQLLNEKKVKIRQQQKIITELNANGASAEEPQSTEEIPTPKEPTGKRALKRKAKAVEHDSSEPETVAAVKSEAEDSEIDRMTEATASEADGDEDEAEDEEMGEVDEPEQEPAKDKKAVAAPPPPPRQLPFQRRRPAPAADGSASDDDEL